MKRIFVLLTLAAALLSLNSCGLPGALVRTTGNLVSTAANAVGGL